MNPLFLSLISALIILDKYAFGEFGISQPIIAGTIIGAIFGDINTGIFLGAMLQLIFLIGIPIGREIPPDGQAAGIIGTGSFFLLSKTNPTGSALCLAVVFALISAIIGGALEVFTRRRNERFFHMYMRKEKHLYYYHLLGLGTAFLRSFFLVLPFFLIAAFLKIPEQFPRLSKDLLIIIGISIGLANSIYLFLKKSTIIYLIVGGLCGLALLVF